MVKSHIRDIKTSWRDDETRKGTPKDFTFSWNRGNRYDETETKTTSWTDAAGTSNGNSSSQNVVQRSLRDIQAGTSKGGTDVRSAIDILKYGSSRSERKGVSETPTYKFEFNGGNSSSYLECRNGDNLKGWGVRLINSGSLNWSRSTDKTAWWWGTTTSGSTDWVFAPERRDNLSWGNTLPVPAASFWGDVKAFWAAIGEDIANDPAVQWVASNCGDLLRIAGGALEFGLGLATFVGTAGFGALPGVGLMALGIDQIITGVWNISSGVQAPSVFEFGGYSAARGVGFDEGTSQTIGHWTPAALSLGMLGVGGLLRRFSATAIEGRAILGLMQTEAGANLALSARMNGLVGAGGAANTAGRAAGRITPPGVMPGNRPGLMWLGIGRETGNFLPHFAWQVGKQYRHALKVGGSWLSSVQWKGACSYWLEHVGSKYMPLPVLNLRLALGNGITDVTCLTAALRAWNRGNYYLPGAALAGGAGYWIYRETR